MDVDRHIEERKEIRHGRAYRGKRGDQTGEGSLLDVDRHIEERKEIRHGRAAYWMLIRISRKER